MPKANILIVEDEAVVAADLAGKLERAGYRTIGTFADGEQAIDQAQTTTPDLILMDIRLAGRLDGIETAKRIRAVRKVPIVYLTAHSDVDTLQRATATGSFGYILKPFDERDLTTQIEIALYKHVAERSLRESEERYRTLVETAMDSIVTLDQVGVIVSCNAATERMFGSRREEMLGRNIAVLIPSWSLHDEDGSAGLKRMSGLWRELKGQRRNGGMFPVEIAVSESFMDGDLQYTGILRDVSERKRNEAELRWRAGLLEQAHEAVIVRRPEAGIVYWNRGAVELYGWTFAEAFGRTPAELFLTDASLCEEQLKTTGQWQGEVQHRTKAGAIVTVESRQVMVKEEDGLFIMETNRDVTDRRLAHERVLRLAAELEHRVRERTQELVRSQELLRRLASELTIAEQRERRRIATDLHDYLAQLLVCIRLKVSQARTHQLPSEAAAWLGEAEDVLQQALDYTRSLVAQLAPMVLHEFGLPTALKWLVQQMKGQQLIVSLDMAEEESIALPEDQAILLFQSVRELLINVVKHAKADKAAVHVRVESENLRITVQDEGRGFDPTESATLSDNGELAAQSNLAKFGLFSIRERMKALGGQLEFRSQPGLGTTAILILPLTDRRNTADGISDIPLSETSHVELPIGLSDQKSAMIRVLLVDDHAMMRQGLRGILEGDRDITVVGEAGDGIEAVAVAAALRPDVVIMDINMPKMDGVEATKRIKARFPSMVVIGLSMHNSGHHMEAMREAGAFTYLSKESVAEQLKKTILHCHPRAERLDGQDLTSQTAPLTKETATSPPLPHHTL